MKGREGLRVRFDLLCLTRHLNSPGSLACAGLSQNSPLGFTWRSPMKLWGCGRGWPWEPGLGPTTSCCSLALPSLCFVFPLSSVSVSLSQCLSLCFPVPASSSVLSSCLSLSCCLPPSCSFFLSFSILFSCIPCLLFPFFFFLKQRDRRIFGQH